MVASRVWWHHVYHHVSVDHVCHHVSVVSHHVCHKEKDVDHEKSMEELEKSYVYEKEEVDCEMEVPCENGDIADHEEDAVTDKNNDLSHRDTR